MIPTKPKGPTQAGSRIPKRRSREYLSGSRIIRAVDTAMLSRGSSAPPSVTHTGLPQWAFLVAIDIDAMTPRGPKGLSSPKTVSTPPPNSESPARYAQGRPGRIPSISMKPLVPSNPGPPKDPKSFWAPWPAIREPCTTRTIIGAASFSLEPLDLVVFILTPSVVFSGVVKLPASRAPAEGLSEFPDRLLEGVLQRGISALLTAVGVGCGRPCPRRPEAVMSPPHYPSDLSDQEWAILEPLLSSAEKRGRVRRSGRTNTSRTPSSTS